MYMAYILKTYLALKMHVADILRRDSFGETPNKSLKEDVKID
jgi:hypothetical protein